MAAELDPGTAVGDVVIEGRLGGGGFASLYRARRGDRPVAVKVLAGELAASEQALARFAREVELLRRIESRHIVRLEAIGRLPDRRPYLVMELLEGEDLEARLERGALPAKEVARLVAELATALDQVHAAGVIHRDIKAANVFIAEPEGRAVLLDFGIARPALAGATITHSREILGTPGCMAPEQIAGARVDRRADVYALGALAYHMLCGQPPWGEQPVAVVQQLHRFAERPRPSAITGDRAADACVARAMSLDPDERHESAGALAAELAAALGATPREAAEPTLWISADDAGELERAVAALGELGLARTLEAGWSCAFSGRASGEAIAAALAGIDVERFRPGGSRERRAEPDSKKERA